MIIQLTPSLILTDERAESRYGIPVLVNRADDATAYGPADIITVYNMVPQPAAHLVHRFGKLRQGEDLEKCKLFLSQWPEGPQLEVEVPAAPVEERPFSIIDGTPVPYSLTVRCARPCCKNGDDVQAVNHLVDIQDFLQRARPSQKLIRFEGAYAFYGEPYVPGALEAPKLLNTRVPQPNRETADYGVPPFVVDAAAVLYHHRNACPEEEIEIVDQAIVRLYQPWIRKSIGEGL